MYEFHGEQFLNAPLDEVFSFFSNPANLDELTPDRLRFEIETDTPIEMREGLELDYTLRIRGIPVSWRSRIEVWEPPERFVDVQVHGPYTHWRHEHAFDERDGDTLVTDHVAYGVPGWIFAPLIHYFFVRPDVVSIFDYRRKRLEEMFNDTGEAS